MRAKCDRAGFAAGGPRRVDAVDGATLDVAAEDVKRVFNLTSWRYGGAKNCHQDHGYRTASSAAPCRTSRPGGSLVRTTTRTRCISSWRTTSSSPGTSRSGGRIWDGGSGGPSWDLVHLGVLDGRNLGDSPVEGVPGARRFSAAQRNSAPAPLRTVIRRARRVAPGQSLRRRHPAGRRLVARRALRRVVAYKASPKWRRRPRARAATRTTTRTRPGPPRAGHVPRRRQERVARLAPDHPTGPRRARGGQREPGGADGDARPRRPAPSSSRGSSCACATRCTGSRTTTRRRTSSGPLPRPREAKNYQLPAPTFSVRPGTPSTRRSSTSSGPSSRRQPSSSRRASRTCRDARAAARAAPGRGRAARAHRGLAQRRLHVARLRAAARPVRLRPRLRVGNEIEPAVQYATSLISWFRRKFCAPGVFQFADSECAVETILAGPDRPHQHVRRAFLPRRPSCGGRRSAAACRRRAPLDADRPARPRPPPCRSGTRPTPTPRPRP